VLDIFLKREETLMNNLFSENTIMLHNVNESEMKNEDRLGTKYL
jgi:hypothetical protein